MTDPEPTITITNRRLDLHAILLDLLGNPNVYFQNPPSTGMIYPCIMYERDNAFTNSADNLPYAYTQRYQVTYIDRMPDSDVLGKLAARPLCQFSRHFATSGLNHDVFVLYH